MGWLLIWGQNDLLQASLSSVPKLMFPISSVYCHLVLKNAQSQCIIQSKLKSVLFRAESSEITENPHLTTSSNHLKISVVILARNEIEAGSVPWD